MPTTQPAVGEFDKLAHRLGSDPPDQIDQPARVANSQVRCETEHQNSLDVPPSMLDVLGCCVSPERSRVIYPLNLPGFALGWLAQLHHPYSPVYRSTPKTSSSEQKATDSQ